MNQYFQYNTVDHSMKFVESGACKNTKTWNGKKFKIALRNRTPSYTLKCVPENEKLGGVLILKFHLFMFFL
ncbi:hypothetical protein HZS_4983 [Henneguya salminicola]|nr:hypothetical protein HZS_4983 [Henneguya salminicola]